MATTDHPDEQHDATQDFELSTLRDIRNGLITQLVALQRLDPGSFYAADRASSLSTALLNIDQVIHANMPARRHVDARQIARDQKAALEAAWSACASTIDGDRVVAALRATALFGAF